MDNNCENCINCNVCKYKDSTEKCSWFIHKAILNKPKVDKITSDRLEVIKLFIIDQIIMNPYIMLEDTYRAAPTEIGTVDLPEVIASLYELLHRYVTGESYEYMFHWANKVGSDVDDDLFLMGEEDG